MHLYGYGLGKYYGFSVCGNRADRTRLTIDPELVDCRACKRTKAFKKITQ